MIKSEKKIWYYQIVFNDGRVIRSDYVTKQMAESVGRVMEYEMARLNVQSVEWGKL
jgi:hypothetical protein